MENQDSVFIDIKKAFYRIRTHKFLFIGALIIAVAFAYIYNRMAPKIYKFEATMLLGQEQNGPRLAGIEMFSNYPEGISDKRINVEDEIGKLTSYSMVRKMVEELQLQVSYFKGNDIGKNELFGEQPFRVVFDTMHIQPLEMPFFITITSKNSYRLTVQGGGVPLYDFVSEKTKGELQEVAIDEELEFGQRFSNEYMSFTVFPEDEILEEKLFGQQYHFMFVTLESVAENFRNRLLVNPINRNSFIIRITSEGVQPEKDITMINRLMTVFREIEYNEKRQAGLQTLEFIRGKLGEATEKLSTSETAEVRYKAQTGAATDEMPRQLQEQLATLQDREDNINAALSLYDNLIQLLESKSAISTDIISPQAFGVNDEVLNGFFEEQRELNQEKTKLENYVQKDMPRLRVIDMKISNSKEQMKQYIQRKRDASFSSLRDTEERINKLQANLSRIPSIERRQDELRREVNYDEKVYQDLMLKENMAQIHLSNITHDVQILDQAKMVGDSPISPNTTFNYIVALLIGFFLPYGFVVLKDTLDDRIKNQEDLKAATSIPFLGMIIRGDKEDKLVVEPQAKSITAESFRSLRVNLDHQKEFGKGVIGFTSTISGEGKTFCSVNLAHTYALSGKKTILVCADLRKPKIEEYFDGLYEEGLSNYLNQECEIDETIQSTAFKNLDVINAGPTPENPTVILDSERMDFLISELKLRYDQVVIDTPPIGFVSEYFILKRFIDISIYVVRANYTDKRHLTEVNELFRSNKVKNMNMLLNDVKLPDTHMYYGNAYANGYTYYE